jgi:hypothetical protein
VNLIKFIIKVIHQTLKCIMQILYDIFEDVLHINHNVIIRKVSTRLYFQNTLGTRNHTSGLVDQYEVASEMFSDKI